MAEWKTKEGYEAWKAKKLKASQEKSADKEVPSPNQSAPLLEPDRPKMSQGPEKKCRYCAMHIPMEAKICPYCRKTIGWSKGAKIVAILFIAAAVFVVQGIIMRSPTKDGSSTNTKPVTANAVTQTADTWIYGETKDEMTGKVTKYATKESVNTVNFGFPYQGDQHGTIMVLDNGVLFYVKKGQITCQGGSAYGECRVLVKFDDFEARYVDATEIGDKSTTITFTEPDFLRKLKRSKKLMIRVEVFQNGLPDFTFDVRGLDVQ